MQKKVKVILDNTARESIKKGVEILAGAVKSTLGPKGRNVILDRPDGQSPAVTKDGITVAKSIDLADRTENLGVRLLREATARTGDTAGDGTTTATVLGEAIFLAGIKQISSGTDAMALKRGIDKILPVVLDIIEDASIATDDPEKIRQVASIAANGEEKIGELLLEAFEKVGSDGVIALEEAQGCETYVELVEGMQFDRGFHSPYFMTDPIKSEAIYEDPEGVLILITDQKINNVHEEVIPILQLAQTSQKPMLIIAEDYSPEALQTLVVNRIRNGFKIVAVKAPGFGNRRKDMLDDIAGLTGGIVISADTGGKIKDVKLNQLGRAKKIIVEAEETALLEGFGTEEVVDARIAFVKQQIKDAEETEQTVQKEFFETRLAKLTAGIARVYVGGATEAEMLERKDRVEDALFATRAAIQEGILPGGGVALLNSVEDAKEILPTLSLTQEEEFGAKLLLSALESPIRQIVRNAGDSDDMVVSRIKESADPHFGYNAATGIYENLIDAGVIDPAKVVRLALENATSAAGTLLTTECAVVEIDDEE